MREVIVCPIKEGWKGVDLVMSYGLFGQGRHDINYFDIMGCMRTIPAMLGGRPLYFAARVIDIDNLCICGEQLVTLKT